MTKNSQIIKQTLPRTLVNAFICENFLDKGGFYMLNKNVYKKLLMFNKLKPFIDKLDEHYYCSKKGYLRRSMNYRNFVTIIRQLCKYFDIKIVSTIKYSRSNYEIEYDIYLFSNITQE